MPKPIAVLPLWKYKKQTGDVVVSTVSNSSDRWRGLSPFIAGPCRLYDGHVSRNMENAWQFSKVYKNHLDWSGDPSTEWWEWAKQGWNDSKAHRYPMGKGNKPEYSYWEGLKLDYIEARKTIYAPLYAEAVQKTKAWRELKEIYEIDKRRLVLLDYDAYDHVGINKSLTEVLHDPSKIMGHAFVLAMLLQKDPALKHLKLRKSK